MFAFRIVNSKFSSPNINKYLNKLNRGYWFSILDRPWLVHLTTEQYETMDYFEHVFWVHSCKRSFELLKWSKDTCPNFYTFCQKYDFCVAFQQVPWHVMRTVLASGWNYNNIALCLCIDAKIPVLIFRLGIKIVRYCYSISVYSDGTIAISFRRIWFQF